MRLDTHVVDRVCAVDEEGVDLKKRVVNILLLLQKTFTMAV